MSLRLTLAALVAVVGLLAGADQAAALRCPEPKPEDQFKTADAAIVGHLLEIRPTATLPEPGHNYGGVISAEFRWQVDEVYKGADWFRPGDVITVGGMYYGLRLPPPEPPAESLGALLRLYEGHWAWEGMMCDRISVADLRRVAAEAEAFDPPEEVLTPVPAPPASGAAPQLQPPPGPVAFLRLAGKTGYELRQALAKGIKLKVGCGTPCRVTAELYLRPALARRLEFPRSSQSVLVAKGSAKAPGIQATGTAMTTLQLRFSRRAKERLRRTGRVKVWLKLTVTSTPGAEALSRPTQLPPVARQ